MPEGYMKNEKIVDKIKKIKKKKKGDKFLFYTIIDFFLINKNSCFLFFLLFYDDIRSISSF